MTEQTILVALLDEGTPVWRPVPAVHNNDGTFTLTKPSDYDAADEHWEFPPGSTVVGEARRMADGVSTVAVRLKDQSRRTA